MFIADRAEAEADEILVDVAYTGLLALVLRGYSFRPSPPVVPRYPFCFFFAGFLTEAEEQKICFPHDT